MRILVASPLRAMSGKMHSHRSAQGVIYADQIRNHVVTPHDTIHCNLTGTKYEADFNKFDVCYVYHGNDWTGSANLFGGIKGFPFTYNLANFSKFKGQVYSLEIDFPDLAGQLYPRVHKFIQTHGYDALPQAWKDVDWENLRWLQSTAKTVKIFDLIDGGVRREPKIAIGDSHAISCYRPGWQVNSVPFKTLWGATSMGFQEFLPLTKMPWSEIEVYFGNIDVRHHLCRQPSPPEAARLLARRYIDECIRLHMQFGCKVRIWELLPIENESRKLPKTGYFEGKPFHGNWGERDAIRKIFMAELDKLVAEPAKWLSIYRWTRPLLNHKGELDFKHMEKPQSVHLSRAAYPLWQGADWNGIDDSPEDWSTEKPKDIESASLADFLA